MFERPRVSTEPYPFDLDAEIALWEGTEYGSIGIMSYMNALLTLKAEREETVRLRRLVFEHHSVAMHHWCGAEAQGENWGRPCPVCIEVDEAALAGRTVGATCGCTQDDDVCSCEHDCECRTRIPHHYVDGNGWVPGRTVGEAHDG